jgi:Right handed beta helix region
LDVDCDDGGSLQDAIDEADGYTGVVTINITGTCNESVQIERSGVRLFGAAPGAEIRGVAPWNWAVRVIASTDVWISGLTLSGTLDTLFAVRGSSVLVRDSRVLQGTRRAVSVSESVMNIQDSEIRDGEGTGVYAFNNSSVNLSTSSVTGRRTGVQLTGGASLFASPLSTISGNETGLLVSAGTAELWGRIEANGLGVSLLNGGRLLVAESTEIRDNASHGVYLRDLSPLGSNEPGPVGVITGNDGWGVYCDPSTIVPQPHTQLLATVEVYDNSAGQTNCVAATMP